MESLLVTAKHKVVTPEQWQVRGQPQNRHPGTRYMLTYTTEGPERMEMEHRLRTLPSALRAKLRNIFYQIFKN